MEEIIYLRKSRSDNPRESVKETLEKHERQLQEYALREFGHEIPESNIYREVASGGGESLEDRPVFQQVLKRLEDKNIKKLLCVDTARISRSGIYGAGEIINYIRFANVLLCTLGRTYDLNDEFDRKFIEMEMLNSNQYLEYTKQVLSRGRLHSINVGCFVGSTAPYGYRKVKLKDEKGFTLEANENAEIVKLMFEMVIEGKGTTSIAHHLNTLDVKPMKNEYWTPEIVKNILTNITYAGFLTWGKRKTVTVLENGSLKKKRPINKKHTLVKGKHKALVSIEDFDKVQRLISSNQDLKVPETKELKNALAGIVVCSFCGRHMTRRPYNTPRKRPQRVYEIDKVALNTLLREHKEKSNLSIMQIAKELDVTRDVVVAWFSPNLKKFYLSETFSDKWYDLKKLLNIKTNKFDKSITTYDTVVPEDSLICTNIVCNNISSNLKEVEQAVLSHLEAYLKNFNYFLDNYEEEVKKTVAGNLKTIKKIQKDIDKLEIRLSSVMEAYELKDYTREQFLKRKKEIESQIEELQEKKSKLEQNKEEDKIIRYKKMIPKLSLCINKYDNLSIENKNKLLKTIINKIIYSKNEKSTKKTKAKFNLEIHLKL